jgi:hypothetical protein
MQDHALLKRVARSAELLFTLDSLLLWTTLPLPPTQRVMWNFVLLTTSIILGIIFFRWLKAGGTLAWTCAALFGTFIQSDILLGIARGGPPDWSRPPIVISFILVYLLGVTQGVVVLCAVARWWKVRSSREVAIGA